MEIKDKPNSMSVRDWIIKKIGTGIMIPENIVKMVVAHQFDSAYEALDKYNSIEISGFGKFYYNRKKAEKELKRSLLQKATYEKILNDQATTEKKRQQVRRRLKILSLKIENLIKKENNGKG